MSKNQVIILNGNDFQEFEIVKSAVDINGEPFYICVDKDKEMVAVLFKKIEDIKKMEDKIIRKIIERDDNE